MGVLDGVRDRIEALLDEPDARYAQLYPGESTARQPVHSVYVPADGIEPDLPGQWGRRASESVAAAGGIEHLIDVHGFVTDPAEAERIAALVTEKLRREPIEDLRLDFEDGYGAPGDEAEDRAVERALEAIGAMRADDTMPPWVGIRFKCLEPQTRARGIRTLESFVTGLARSGLPTGLVLTLPKVTSVEQVEAMVILLQTLESRLGLTAGTLRFEIQVETPQAILGPAGTSLLPPMIAAGQGRITGMPYGTYDYSASLGIAPAQQSMEHPAADHAKAVMQAAAAGTGVRVSDGSTNILPVGDAEARDRAWALHGRLVMRSLRRGFYQGWDMHPAQVPSRYAATYAFFRQGLADIVHRLENYLGSTGTGVLDEPATARAMASFLLRGVDCGAVAAEEMSFHADDLRDLVAGRTG